MSTNFEGGRGDRALRVWMSAERITVRDMASRVGCSESFLSHVRAGRRMPGRKLAVAIARETAGAVPVSCWDAEAAAA